MRHRSCARQSHCRFLKGMGCQPVTSEKDTALSDSTTDCRQAGRRFPLTVTIRWLALSVFVNRQGRPDRFANQSTSRHACEFLKFMFNDSFNTDESCDHCSLPIIGRMHFLTNKLGCSDQFFPSAFQNSGPVPIACIMRLFSLHIWVC
jgi:hypothetical protein